MIELVLLDGLLALVTGFLPIASIFLSKDDLFVTIFCLVMGIIMIILSNTFGSWLTYLREKQREIIMARYDLDKLSAKVLILDFGRNNKWIFRILSGLAIGFSTYHLV